MIDPTIPLSAIGRPAPMANPFEVAQSLGSMRVQAENARALAAERDAITEQKRQQIAAAQKTQVESQQLETLFGSGQPVRPEQVYGIVGPDRGAKILQGLSALQETNLKTETARRTLIGSVVGGLKALPEPMRPDAYTSVRQHLVGNGIFKPEDIPEQYNPAYLDAAQQWALTPKEQLENKRAEDKQAAELPGTIAKSTQEARSVAAGLLAQATSKEDYAAKLASIPDPAIRGAFPPAQAWNAKSTSATVQKIGMTPEQQSQAADRAAQRQISWAQLQETIRNHQALEEGASLTPAAVDKAAEMFATTGQLPSLGMGRQAAQMRSQIINRATTLYPSVQFATSKAAFQANQASLTNVTKTLDTLTAFEKAGGRNLNQFLDLAAKLPDTGIPWVNTPVRNLNRNLVGDEWMPAIEAARLVALREIARVTNDPKLSGVLSDSARQEVLSLSPENATFASIKHVAQVLRNDMANVHSSLSEQKTAIEERLKAPEATGGTAPQPVAPTPAAKTAPTPNAAAGPKVGMIRARDPQGNLHEAKAGTPLPAGWTLEK